MTKQRATLDGKRLRPSAYVSGIDVVPGDLVATITGVNATFELPNTKTIAALLLKIDGQDRYTKINAANEATLIDLFGREARGWIGKRIVLYFDPEVEYGRGRNARKTGGVRIRLDARPKKRADPDKGASAGLRKEFSAAIKAAADGPALEQIGEGIKAAAAQLTAKDAAALRREYGARYDSFA